MGKEVNGEKVLYEFEKLTNSKDLGGLIYKTLYNTKDKYDKTRIMKAIQAKDANALREISRYFYYKSGIYKRLIEYLSSMYLMYYKVTPKNKDKLKDRAFEINHDKVFSYISSLDMDTFLDVSTVVWVEGIFFGYQRNIDSEYTIQQLPTNYCRTLAKYPSGNYVVEFDLTFFNSYKFAEDRQIELLKLYPKELQQAWYKFTTGEIDYKWYKIPEQFGMCFPMNDLGMPPLTGIFTELVELDNYKKLEKVKTALDLVKIVVQRIPLDDENQPAYELEEAQSVHKNLMSMLQNNNNIDGYTTPFDVDVLNLSDNKDSSDKNSLLKAERSVFSEAGMSSGLGNAEGNVALNNSIKSDESWVWKIISLYERWINTHINRYVSDSKNYNFNFEILPITWYNKEELIDEYFKGATVGLTKLEFAISLGIKQEDLINKLAYERGYLDIDSYITPLATSYTQAGESNGAPSKDESNLSDSGLKTKDADSNNK